VTSLGDIVPTETMLPASPRGLPIPWWGKIAAKTVLARVLPSYRARKAFGLFLHGNLDHNIDRHATFVTNVLAQHRRLAERPARAVLELGPGNSVATAIFAAAEGVERVWLADVGDFASQDMALYRESLARVAGEASELARRIDLSDRARMLASLNAAYLTDGTASLAEIPDGSLDVALSTAVLEHVRRAEFASLARELFRMLRAGGTCYHHVDLMDHLGGALNNLRFSEAAWESALMAEGGFYTNRIRCREMVALFAAAGFDTAVTHIARWPALPTPRAALAPPFRDLPEDELRIANFAVLLRKPA
jgi:SAM-dependent methyltransferase